MEDLDYLDSSLRYVNILTNAKFLEMTERDFHNLKNVRQKPYFCRIDFEPEQSEEKEELYIGKTSLYRQEDHAPVIVDWRSPIANLYYEGRIGEASYIPEAGEVKGAYFIYTYAENFNPDSLMILAPNRLFISYISEVLPELGVEEVVQTTFIDFVLSIIGKKYKLVSTDKKLLAFINDGNDATNNVHFLCTQSADLLNKKRIEIEDAGALLYLKEKIFGVEGINIKNVVIDEAQDFSVFQLYALKTVLKTDLFTILGDLSQGIHSYRGIHDWQDVIDGVFPKSNFATLRQSYRTTVEIMNLANEIIQQSKSPGIVLAEPVVRHGDLPEYHSFENKDGFVSSVVKQVKKLKKEGFRTIALIGKSMRECQQIKKHMEKGSGFSTQLLEGEGQLEQKDVVVVPSYIAKGLEFEAVFIINIDDEYHAHELDIKLLHVAMTRPLNRLFIYSRDNSISLVHKVSKTILRRYIV
jgi:DNA helicase IV